MRVKGRFIKKEEESLMKGGDAPPGCGAADGGRGAAAAATVRGGWGAGPAAAATSTSNSEVEDGSGVDDCELDDGFLFECS